MASVTRQKYSYPMFVLCLFVMISSSSITRTTAFAPSRSSRASSIVDGPLLTTSSSIGKSSRSRSRSSTGTCLSERKWNFNEGQSPWGMKQNAETWNGRIAQVAFVWIFFQELVTGKGVFQGLEEGNLFFIANAALFGIVVVGLTGFLAFKGDDDYTKA